MLCAGKSVLCAGKSVLCGGEGVLCAGKSVLCGGEGVLCGGEGVMHYKMTCDTLFMIFVSRANEYNYYTCHTYNRVVCSVCVCHCPLSL